MAKQVQAVRVDTTQEMWRAPGAFKYGAVDGQISGMRFSCPCGCKGLGWLPFKPEPSPSWDWDGNYEEPTLRPSIKQTGACGWHGWLTKGVWREC